MSEVNPIAHAISAASKARTALLDALSDLALCGKQLSQAEIDACQNGLYAAYHSVMNVSDALVEHA